MKLPNAERTVVDIRKLRDYCLSAVHPRGQHKARLFKSALGWTTDDAEDICHKLMDAALRQDANFIGADDYGQRYALDFFAGYLFLHSLAWSFQDEPRNSRTRCGGTYRRYR